jgi:hypothetical protein
VGYVLIDYETNDELAIIVYIANKLKNKLPLDKIVTSLSITAEELRSLKNPHHERLAAAITSVTDKTSIKSVADDFDFISKIAAGVNK